MVSCKNAFSQAQILSFNVAISWSLIISWFMSLFLEFLWGVIVATLPWKYTRNFFKTLYLVNVYFLDFSECIVDFKINLFFLPSTTCNIKIVWICLNLKISIIFSALIWEILYKVCSLGEEDIFSQNKIDEVYNER